MAIIQLSGPKYGRTPGSLDKDKSGRLRYRDPESGKYYYGQDALNFLHGFLQHNFAVVQSQMRARGKTPHEIREFFESTNEYRQISYYGSQFYKEDVYNKEQKRIKEEKSKEVPKLATQEPEALGDTPKTVTPTAPVTTVTTKVPPVAQAKTVPKDEVLVKPEPEMKDEVLVKPEPEMKDEVLVKPEPEMKDEVLVKPEPEMKEDPIPKIEPEVKEDPTQLAVQSVEKPIEQGFPAEKQVEVDEYINKFGQGPQVQTEKKLTINEEGEATGGYKPPENPVLQQADDPSSNDINNILTSQIGASTADDLSAKPPGGDPMPTQNNLEPNNDVTPAINPGEDPPAAAGPTKPVKKTWTWDELEPFLREKIKGTGKNTAKGDKILAQLKRDFSFKYKDAEGNPQTNFDYDQIVEGFAGAAKGIGYGTDWQNLGGTFMGERPVTDPTPGGPMPEPSGTPAALAAVSPAGEPQSVQQMFESAYFPQARAVQQTLQTGLTQAMGTLGSRGMDVSSMAGGLAMPYARALGEQTMKARMDIGTRVADYTQKQRALQAQSILEQQRIQMGGATAMMQAGMSGNEASQKAALEMMKQASSGMANWGSLFAKKPSTSNANTLTYEPS